MSNGIVIRCSQIYKKSIFNVIDSPKIFRDIQLVSVEFYDMQVFERGSKINELFNVASYKNDIIIYLSCILTLYIFIFMGLLILSALNS